MKQQPWVAGLLVSISTLSAPGTAFSESDSKRSAPGWLEEAYRCKAARDYANARTAFEKARQLGAPRQRVALELAYLALNRGDLDEARLEFSTAQQGADAALSRQAQRELRLLPAHLWADIYLDVYGWHRVVGKPATQDVVPTIRGRVLWRPWLALDGHLYAFVQATRDLESRGRGAGGLPEVYADNHALGGGGVLLRLWQRRIAAFAQVGAALNLLDDGTQRWQTDVRIGVFTGMETASCAPPVAPGSRWLFKGCAELYAEAVYVSRDHDNVTGFARPRVSASYLITGPIAWQVIAEGRLAKDRNGDYYNNFVDEGAGHRWRLLKPLRVDLLASCNVGGYLGSENRDPVPKPRHYVDVRFLTATYLEF